MTLYPDDTEQSGTGDMVHLADVIKMGILELTSACGEQT